MEVWLSYNEVTIDLKVRKGKGHRTYNRISIRRSGYICFSGDMFRTYRLDQYRKAQLYCNRETGEVGVELLDDAAAAAARLHPLTVGRPYKRCGIINAKLFFETFGIDYLRFLGPQVYWTTPLRSLGIDRSGVMFRFRVGES